MSHGPAKFTQADIDRITKAAVRNGVVVSAEFIGKDGSKAVITAKPVGDGGTVNEWDDVINGEASTQVR